jgi:hypothetical protein
MARKPDPILSNYLPILKYYTQLLSFATHKHFIQFRE